MLSLTMIILPTVSIGNVPQLALDLLIHTYGATLEATLDDELMYPFAGPLDYVSEPVPGVATPIQTFSLGEHTIVQLRSPPLPNRCADFLNQLKQTLKGDLLVVGSANAGMRLEMDAARLVEVDSAPNAIAESGFFCDAVRAFDAKGLLLYTYEGDNIDNAKEVAAALVNKLGLPVKNWTEPVSWKRLYGKDVPTSVEEGIYA